MALPAHVDKTGRSQYEKNTYVRVGRSAQQCAVRGESELLDVMYRGLTIDYLLHLQDGQRLVATSTHREDGGFGKTVAFGFNPDDLLLLDDDE